MNYRWTTLPAQLDVYGGDDTFHIHGCAGEFRLGSRHGYWSLVVRFNETDSQSYYYNSRPAHPDWRAFLQLLINNNSNPQNKQEVVVLLQEDEKVSEEIKADIVSKLQNVVVANTDGLYSFWPLSMSILISVESKFHPENVKLFVKGQEVDMDCRNCPDRLDFTTERCQPFFSCGRANKGSAFKCRFPIQPTDDNISILSLPMLVENLDAAQRVPLKDCSVPDPFEKHTVQSIAVCTTDNFVDLLTKRRLARSDASSFAAQTKRRRQMRCKACVFNETSQCTGDGCSGPYYREEFIAAAKEKVSPQAVHTVMVAGEELLPYQADKVFYALGTQNRRPRTKWIVGIPCSGDYVLLYANAWHSNRRAHIRAPYNVVCDALETIKCESEEDLKELQEYSRHSDNYVDECRLVALQCLYRFWGIWASWGQRYDPVCIQVDDARSSYRDRLSVTYEHGRTTTTNVLTGDPYKCQCFAESAIDCRADTLERVESSLLNRFQREYEYPFIPGQAFNKLFAQNLLSWSFETPTPQEVRRAWNKLRRAERAANKD